MTTFILWLAIVTANGTVMFVSRDFEPNPDYSTAAEACVAKAVDVQAVFDQLGAFVEVWCEAETRT